MSGKKLKNSLLLDLTYKWISTPGTVGKYGMFDKNIFSYSANFLIFWLKHQSRNPRIPSQIINWKISLERISLGLIYYLLSMQKITCFYHANLADIRSSVHDWYHIRGCSRLSKGIAFIPFYIPLQSTIYGKFEDKEEKSPKRHSSNKTGIFRFFADLKIIENC